MAASFKELDETVTLSDQLQDAGGGPVVLINVFSVAPDEADELVSAWAHDADFMKAQPGYISTQLHKGLAGSSTFINYAVWESVSAFRAAFSNPEFQRRIGQYPDSAVASPHLFQKMTVTNHCVA